MSSLAEVLRTHGRADDLNALAADTKQLKHSEREAIVSVQKTCMKAAIELERLRSALRLTGTLRHLGGMMPGAREVVQAVVDAADAALKTEGRTHG